MTMRLSHRTRKVYLLSYSRVLIQSLCRRPNNYPHEICIDLELGFKFSVRKGFGPVQPLPAPFLHEDPNISRAQELHELLSSFTAAEEAAIQQISPLMSLVRLAHGNIDISQMSLKKVERR